MVIARGGAAEPAAAPSAEKESSAPVIQKETAKEAPSAPTALPESMTAPAEVMKPEGTLNAGIRELGSTNLHPSLIRPPTTTTFHTPPIGEGLLVVGNDSKVVPQLARKWSISQDLSTWTFRLEEGVQFHKGYGEMTAEDVVWSSLQWGENEFQSRRNLVNSFWDDPEGSVETPDPYTIVVDTAAPIADVLACGFLASPSGGAIPAVSKRQTEEIGVEAANRDIAATGPSDPLLADHIHVGAAGTNGGVVVNLAGGLSGCVSADADLIKAIRQNPAGYYVNLHTALNPVGEVRGQLEIPHE